MSSDVTYPTILLFQCVYVQCAQGASRLLFCVVGLFVQCVGLSAASSLELLFTYFANHYWWSGEGWDALESLFSLKPPSLGDREGSVCLLL